MLSIFMEVRVSRYVKRMPSDSTHSDIQEIFGNTSVVLSQKQTPNLLRILTQHKSTTSSEDNGLIKCKNIQCKICKLYIQPCKEFELSNGMKWQVKCKITCNSKNVIYFLKCIKCSCTYIGKTNNMRKRMNGHISDSRHGNTTDKFDKHIFKCLGPNKGEPFFQIFAMMSLSDSLKLLSYESYFHRKGFDTMNNKN